MDDENDESQKPETRSFVSRLKYFENYISTSSEDLSKKRASVLPSRYKQLKQNRFSYTNYDDSSFSIQDAENRPVKPIDLKSRKLTDNGMKPVVPKPSSVTPNPVRRHNHMTLDGDCKQIYSSRSWSLRKKTSQMPTLFQNQSLFNISNFDKSVPCSPVTRELVYSRTVSMTKTSSMVSLFDDDAINSPIVDYNIDWKAIFEKISEKTSNDIENELTNYFHNSNIDLKIFPGNCLHWFMTFDHVLGVVLSEILPATLDVDFGEQISKIPSQVVDIDYDLMMYDVMNLIKCNIRNLDEMVTDYRIRKNNLGQSLGQLKKSIEKYLIKPEGLYKVHREVENICTKLQLLGDVLILIITRISTWKLNKDFPQLNGHKTCDEMTVKFCENSLLEFRDSQRILETQIMKLFKQFSEDNCSEVLQLFDQLFSENLEVSICLPIFEVKLKKDSQMLTILESSTNTRPGEEQFV